MRFILLQVVDEDHTLRNPENGDITFPSDSTIFTFFELQLEIGDITLRITLANERGIVSLYPFRTTPGLGFGVFLWTYILFPVTK